MFIRPRRRRPWQRSRPGACQCDGTRSASRDDFLRDRSGIDPRSISDDQPHQHVDQYRALAISFPEASRRSCGVMSAWLFRTGKRSCNGWAKCANSSMARVSIFRSTTITSTRSVRGVIASDAMSPIRVSAQSRLESLMWNSTCRSKPQTESRDFITNHQSPRGGYRRS